MFIPNQKVVCCEPVISPEAAQYVGPLIKNKIYTIRNIVPGINIHEGEGEVAVYLHEITNSVNPHGIERGYNAERFAPLAEVDEEELNEGILVGADGVEFDEGILIDKDGLPFDEGILVHTGHYDERTLIDEVCF